LKSADVTSKRPSAQILIKDLRRSGHLADYSERIQPTVFTLGRLNTDRESAAIYGILK
jgi:hypothetical protein